jgi:hypothetical protein
MAWPFDWLTRKLNARKVFLSTIIEKAAGMGRALSIPPVAKVERLL